MSGTHAWTVVVRNPVDESGVVGDGGGGLGGADVGVGDWWPGRKKHRVAGVGVGGVGKIVREKRIFDPPRCNPL